MIPSFLLAKLYVKRLAQKRGDRLRVQPEKHHRLDHADRHRSRDRRGARL